LKGFCNLLINLITAFSCYKNRFTRFAHVGKRLPTKSTVFIYQLSATIILRKVLRTKLQKKVFVHCKIKKTTKNVPFGVHMMINKTKAKATDTEGNVKSEINRSVT